MNDYSIFQTQFLDNSIESYLWFAGIIVAGILLKRWVASQLLRLFYLVFKRNFKLAGRQKLLSLLRSPVELLILVLAIYLACNRLIFPEGWNLVSIHQFGLRMVLSRIFESAIVVSFFYFLLRFTDFLSIILLEKAKMTASKADDQLVPFFRDGLKVVLVLIGLFILLAVAFRLDVVGLVAGLGIGGLAIALAAKETLENLLGSFTIFLDKPFVTGDFVRLGTIEGNVESVGFRSTRIRALDKMLVTVPNKRMIEAELINETDRLLRRSANSLMLSFETTEQQLRNITDGIRAIITDNPMIEQGSGNVRFRSFNQIGFEVFVVYLVLTPDMQTFLAVQEEVNFKIMHLINEEGATLSEAFLRKNNP